MNTGNEQSYLFWEKLDRENILSDLNPVQREAVCYGDGPLLVLAGAGSGKTRVLTRRIAWLVSQGVHPAGILAITFTNKAANEMKERLSQLLGPLASRMWVGTFHAIMLHILRKNAEVLGFTPALTILDSSDQQTLIRRLMKEAGISERTLTPRQVQDSISMAKNHLILPEEYAENQGNSYMRREIAQIYQLYQKRMKEQNSMDFDDILLYAVRLLDENPEIREDYQKRFQHVLVDEYQDTNMAQYRLVQLLSGGWGNLCVVGDDDQSIYSFRGANPENILNFERDYPNCKLIKLEQNYRSTANILEAANAVISKNESRKSKSLWTEGKTGSKITFYRAQDQVDEARWIAREIRRLKRSEQIPYSNIALLYRVNALSRNLESALREEGLPYRIYGGLRFYDRMEIRDTLAYLRVLDSPEDRLALTRAINTPKRGIGQVTIERVMERADQEGCTPMDVLSGAARFPELKHAAGRLQSFALLIQELRGIIEENRLNYGDFVALVQSRSGLEAEWEERAKQGDHEAEERLENLRELRSDAVDFEAMQREDLRLFENLSEKYGDSSDLNALFDEGDSGELSLQSLNRHYLERSSLYSSQDRDAAEDSITLMTIHAAKGLEYTVIFLAGAEEGIFPGFRSMESPGEMEEERRLAYVALTRARDLLCISASRNRLLYGQTRYNPVSRFIKDIPDHLIRELAGSRFDESYDGWGRKEEGLSGGFDFSSQPRRGPIPHSDGTSHRENIFLRLGREEKKPGRTEGGDKAAISKLLALPEGSKVRHPRFGIGTLIKKTAIGEDGILSIDFSGKTKHMMASMSKLEIEK